MELLSVVLFFVYTFGLGYGVTKLLKLGSDDPFEINVMRVGFGLALLVLLGVLLNLLRVPLDWRIFFVLSLLSLSPLLLLLKNFKIPEVRFTRTNLFFIVVAVLFFFTLYMYVKGAFAYPFLEDDDPYSHATGVKYVSMEKTLFAPSIYALQYLDPYPPAFEFVMGLMHQTSSSLMWTLKFFNALIISLSIPFFYFFVRRFSSSQGKALLAAFLLASVPAFLSHFIWAIGLTMPLFFVSFYCVSRIREKGWWVLSALVVAATLMVSPTHSTYFGLFFSLYFVVTTIVERRVDFGLLFAGVFGLLLSVVLWWGPALLRWGYRGFMLGIGAYDQSFFKIGGTGSRSYAVSDFVFARAQNMINAPVGFGVVVSLLFCIGMAYLFSRVKNELKGKGSYLAVCLVWFLLCIYAVNSAYLPVTVSAFRTWVLLAVPVALIAVEGAYFLAGLLKSVGIPRLVVFSVVVLGVFFTSFVPKYRLNTTVSWPPGAFWTFDENFQSPELSGYLWLKTLSPDTKVFSFVNEGSIMAFDKFMCAWCEPEVEFRKSGLNQSADDIADFLRQNSYQYVVIGGQEVRKYGANVTNARLGELASKFAVAYQNKGVVFLRVS